MNPTNAIRKVLLAATTLLMLLPCASCAAENPENEPVTISIWHVYGGQTDSPLNDLIDTFNGTVGKEKGIQVEVTMVSNNKNIHNDIIAAASKDPDAAELPDLFVAYPKTVLALPDENILVDYRDYFSEEELGAFVPEFLEDGSQRASRVPSRGQINGIPVRQQDSF